MSYSDWRPLQITPKDAGVPADADGLAMHLESTHIHELLLRHRALHIRGFSIGEGDLARISQLLLHSRRAYIHGNSPRTKIGENLYTSTEFPAEYEISMHNELSYAHSWPSRVLFACATAASTGGATSLVHGGWWLESLSPNVRRDFTDGVCYRQHLHNGRGLGKSWQDTFETEDRAEVERYLAEGEAQWQWKPSGGLQISQTRPATLRHPATGEEVWFCQVDQWHPATLGEETMRDLVEILPPDELPQSVTFADGSPIPAEYALSIRETGQRLAVDVSWHPGDILLIDNIAVGHGRRPFTGTRRILVAMS